MLSQDINSSQRSRTVFLLIFVIAVVLRIFGWNSYDLWFDELGSNLYSAENISRMAELSDVSKSDMFYQRIKNDPHSAAYYALVYMFTGIFGDGHIIRWISIVFSAMALVVFYRLARLFFDRPASLMALLLLSVNPFHIWYAQEARVYAMASFFSLAMMYSFFKGISSKKLLYWIGFGVTGILSIFCSYYSVMLIGISSALFLLKENRKAVKPWLIAVAIIAGVSSLFLPVLSDQISFVQSEFWLPKPTLIVALFTWLIFDLGYSAYLFQYSVGLVLFFVLFGWGVFNYHQESKPNTYLLLALVFVPIVVVYVVSLFIMPLYINRQLLIFSPYYYLLIAYGIVNIKFQKERVIALVCVIVLSLISVVNFYRNYMFDHWARSTFFTGVLPRKNYMHLFEMMREDFQEDDIVVVSDTQGFVMVFAFILSQDRSNRRIKFDDVVFLTYPQYLQPYDLRFLKVKDIMMKMSAEDSSELLMFQPIPNASLGLTDTDWEQYSFKRAWLVSASWFKESEQLTLGMNSTQVQKLFQTSYRKKFIKHQDGVYVELFSQPE